MDKKVIDILSREKIEKEKIPQTGGWASQSLEKAPIFRFKLTNSKVFLLLIPLFIMFIGGVVLTNLAQVEIEIWPKTEALTFRTNLTIDKTVKEVSFLNKAIPGKIFETEKTVSGEFASSGKSLNSKKAEGTVRVYNNYSHPQTLVANTRFQPPLEKFQPSLERGENPWFRSLERITIAAKSSQDVKVIADAAGEKYNIASATFSIPGLAGTPQYTFVYGKSSESMKGGVLKEIAKVVQEDLDKAKAELSKKAEEESKTALKSKIPADFDFLGEASKTEVLESFSLAKPGAELEKFNYQVKAKSQALVFKTEDLKKFANEFILSEIASGKKLNQESLKINYIAASVDFKAGKMNLPLDLGIKAFSPPDEVSLKKALERKSLSEAKVFLENQPEITKVEIKPFPFWLKKIPDEGGKINIKLSLDPAPL